MKGYAKASSFEKVVTILILDDEFDLVTILKHGLEIQGFRVFSFTDPFLALEHFKINAFNYNLVISDLRMPGLNGLELLKKVKDSNPKVRTILMSAYNFEEDDLFQKYVKEGVIDSTIEKPVTIHRLCQRVKDELEVYNSTSHGN